MKNPWLIQRLSKPVKSKLGPNPFGGGLDFGKEALSILGKIWEIDYMGSAEFEWGALPKCLRRIMNNRSNLEFFKMIVPGKSIKKYWKLKEKPLYEDVEVCVICDKNNMQEVRQIIIDLAGDKLMLKEATQFESSLQLKYLEESDRKMTWPCGWVDIENDYLFFTDKGMWINTSKVLFNKEV